MIGEILYLGMGMTDKPTSGGEYGQLRNRKMLSSIFKEVHIIEIPRINLFKHFINLCFFRSYGYTSSLKKIIDNEIKKGYKIVFVDSSGYGGYVKYFKERGLKTVVFCHNIEYDFYKCKFDVNKNLMNWFLIHYMHHQEKLSMKYSDKIIVLNTRDASGIKEYYDKIVDLVLPLFYEKKELIQIESQEKVPEYLLFVGGDFFANNEGILWFVNNVSPYIKINTYIAGGCCEYLRNKIDLKHFANVKLLGFVDDLERLYLNASAVVCPIFSGSGMKTKTIEAMKYGKTIFGTSEAFVGVNADFSQIGGLCNSATDFIQVINSSALHRINYYTHEFYNKTFTDEIIYPKFFDFIKTL